MTTGVSKKLAINGGPKAVQSDPGDIFKWPIITAEDEQAVLEVLRDGRMSHTDVTVQFEKEFAEWMGMKYGLCHNTGTSALHGAMFGCKIGVGDEIIGPSMTYWASSLPVLSLGATIVFADLKPNSLNIDPADIEHRITDRTRAIVPVHYAGYPCDMDEIMDIARRHNLKVIEDVSHAQGGRYKGRMVGTFGDVAAMSLMSGKSFAIGEGGILVTNDDEIFQRAIAFGHYERTGEAATRYSEVDRPWITLPSLTPLRGMPLGGYKYRMHQLSSAVGRVQLKYYDERIAEIDRAMNYFWDGIEVLPGIIAYRPPKGSGSTMAGWYTAHGIYAPEQLDGFPLARLGAGIRAEGGICDPGVNPPMHLHPVLNDADVYGHGTPTRLAHSDRDVRQGSGTLPVTEGIQERTFGIPWFKHFRKKIIDEHIAAYRKVVENIREIPE